MNFEISKNKSLVVLIVLVLLILQSDFLKTYICEKNVSFINPSTGCGNRNIVNKKEYKEFKERVIEYIKQEEETGELEHIGVWFRDLSAGPTFGINEREDFVPASLLKLPLALAFYDLQEESDNNLLETSLIYTGTTVPVPKQTYRPAIQLVPSKKYTIKELIRHSLVYSDNFSSQFLYEYLLKNFNKAEPLLFIYRDLGIISSGTNFNQAGINTKGYASIFRQLYNSSLLNPDHSEEVLEMLSETNFVLGLRAGVPPNVRVSHKFGERIIENNNNELHDCGIIYYPDNPYILCIMTKGKDLNYLANIVANISKMVYEEFNSRGLK